MSGRFSRRLSVWVVGLVLVAGFAGLSGCGGGPTVPGSTPQTGSAVKVKSVLSDVATKKTKSKYVRKVGKSFVIELPTRNQDD
jgi:hypothetical protein